MLKNILRNQDNSGEFGTPSGTGGSESSAHAAQAKAMSNLLPGGDTGSGSVINQPKKPEELTSNDLAACVNGVVHQLNRFTSQDQQKILGSVLALTGIKLP